MNLTRSPYFPLRCCILWLNKQCAMKCKGFLTAFRRILLIALKYLTGKNVDSFMQQELLGSAQNTIYKDEEAQ